MDDTAKEQNATHCTVRVTNHNKIKNFVSFALGFFDKSEDTSIMFHTLPHEFFPFPGGKERKKPTDDTTSVGPKNNQPQRSTTRVVTETIPRLITVVEIIKREFLKNLALKHSPRLAGLHQYTEVGCLEDLQNSLETSFTVADESFDDLFDKRAHEVVEALSGKNHVKRKRTPYMKITLSLNAIPTLAEQGASYQPPTIRKISKSAKSRAKKRERNRRGAKEDDGPQEVDT